MPTHGSPPRAWGRPPRRTGRPSLIRITPTGVGTASASNWPSITDPDHPHGRGDGTWTRRAAASSAGSPPRAWGRHLDATGCGVQRRITPTGVGTAAIDGVAGRRGEDHPHGRGDGFPRRRCAPWQCGSPPRAWGRRACREASYGASRITPTGVGTALQLGDLGGRTPDHPHGRGDGGPGVRRGHPGRGSPPRAWGRLNERRAPFGVQRITPTGVGTARRGTASGISPTDHPHGRGDGDDLDHITEANRGSPPRAWGRRPVSPSRSD